MSKRKKSQMRHQEAGLLITEDFVLARNAAGEILNEYVRHKSPLLRFYEAGLRKEHAGAMAQYEAGITYGNLWREAWHDRSPAHIDPTRIIVDTSTRNFEPSLGNAEAQSELDEIERQVLGRRGRLMLDAICGREQTMTEYAFQARMSWRRVKAELPEYLKALAAWFNRQSRR